MVLSAVISGVSVAVLGYISNLADIAAIDPHALVSIAVIAAIASILKAFASDSSGKILGKL